MPASSSQTAAVPPPQPPLWRSVWAALRGGHVDYTSADLPRAILLLAVPMVLELVMESTFGLVDIYFVGKLGPEAVATVGLTASVIILVFAVALGLGIGATAVVSRRIGEGKPEAAAVAAVQSILLVVAVSLPVSIVGVLLAPRLLLWMGGSPDVAAGWHYTAWLFGGSATIFLLFLNNSIFRGAGDAAIAMRVLWLANLINMVLDPCLIFGLGPFPELGLAGAAIATTIGRGLGVVFQFWVLFGSASRVRITRRHLRLDRAVMKQLARISLSGMGQYLVATASWLGIMRIIALFGAPTLAGYTIALRLIHFAILPAWGMSNAASTLVGQNLGARRPDRAERAVWITMGYNVALMGTLALVFGVSAEPLIRFFSIDPEVVSIGAESLRILTAVYIFVACTMVLAQAFNGAGDSDTPTWINFVCYWLVQLPLAYYLARPAGFGVHGVYYAIIVAGIAWAAIGLVLFRRGGWKQQQV